MSATFPPQIPWQLSRGVLKLSDVPWNVSKSKIIDLFHPVKDNLNAVPARSWNYVIHIITDRYDNRTWDVFVEFKSPEYARCALKLLENTDDAPRIQGRRICVEESSTAVMARAVFPFAQVEFEGEGYRPKAAYKGLFGPDDLLNVRKTATNLMRTPERVYESFLSALQMLPDAYANNPNTHENVEDVVVTAKCLIKQLLDELIARNHPEGLTWRLLESFVDVIDQARYFTTEQKVHIMKEVPFYNRSGYASF
ncbi:hypothetical protein P152DRAFT_452581 [Eremomyces bilateralis CBS 781.70]|uniref:RRM domain-containing protein n=1 Tax=Eremomyces bilateralis CBS 781.70 TaxID=1392243 RepID=A0A6G1FST7_9PEZI|nr:uncharacterized protein P152DRAFT_452581 [Eremomyces bilateralis CBS 781.70]KAF1808778.1 hypothetical protein P152DRAFT_452581 [Eremomyces bilateralis CBS 781.70]